MPCNICNCMHGCWHILPSGLCPSLSTYFYVAVHYYRSSERRMPRRTPTAAVNPWLSRGAAEDTAAALTCTQVCKSNQTTSPPLSPLP